MRAFFKKYHSSLTIITIFVTVIVILIYSAYYLSVMIREKTLVLKQNKMDYALTQDDVRAISALRNDRRYVEAYHDITNILLPNTDEEKVRLFATIEDLAHESGNQDVVLAVKDLPTTAAQARAASVDPDAKDGAAMSQKKEKSTITPSSQQYMFVTVSVTGTYSNVLTFMSRIENMPYLSDILRIRILKKTANDMSKGASVEEDIAQLPIDHVNAEMDVAFYLAQ